ncbi:MAG: tetratricopeptide repeat protein [Litorilituus sp.]|nr:tetratricopeptide repeat protein [Litorilituus sp.]
MEIYQTEEQQVEAIKGYWQENGNMIIAGVVLGFAGFIGFNFYKENQLENELSIADSYQALVESATEDKGAFNKNAQAFINENSETSYASLTALALAKEAASSKNWAEVQAQLSAAIASAPSDGIKGIASLRLARIQIQQAQYEQALATLAKPLPESFTAAIEETKGDTYLLQGKKELARTAYQAAIAANGLSSSPNLQMKLDDLATAVNLPATALIEEAAK